jgi:hypothetical protein
MGLDWYVNQKVVCIKEPHDIYQIPVSVPRPQIDEIYTIRKVQEEFGKIFIELEEIIHPYVIGWNTNLFKPIDPKSLQELRNLLVPLNEKKRVEEKV